MSSSNENEDRRTGIGKEILKMKWS